MSTPPEPPSDATDTEAQQPVCVRHTDRPTRLRCTRCDRPACPECLREASVGYQCVDCVTSGQRSMRTPKTIAGAPLSAKAVVVPVLIALNVLVYLYTAFEAGSAQNSGTRSFYDLALIVPMVAQGDWWRLFTSGFLHIGLIHLVMNMVALWVLGRDVELILGRTRFIAVYLLSLLGGSTAVYLFGELLQPVAGASGAVYGLMGSIAVAAFKLKLDLKPVLLIIGLNVVLTFSLSNISWQGHAGGIVVGALAMAGMLYAPAARRNLWQGGVLAGLLVVLLVFLAVRDAQLADAACEWVGPELRCGRGSAI